MKYSFRGLTLALCAVALVAGATDVSAQAWPQKPIRIINPFPPGGGTDVFARPLALKLSVALGQQVIIENMAGAGGTVGAARAAKEPPDGYVWFMGAVHHTIAETLYTKLPYSLERDFAPVTVVAFVPNVVVIHPKHDFKSIQDLIAYAKANPGQAQLRLRGERHDAPSVGRAVQDDDRHAAHPRPVQGCGTARPGAARRRGRSRL